MKNILVLLIVGLIILLLVNKKEEWKGFYYPDGCLGCEENYIFSPSTFDNKEACLAWAENTKIKRNNESDLYECGLNCKENDYGSYICKETVD